MAAFHVFVEGPVDSAPDATARLAEAMSKRYGLPASEVATRLARGRFRVKANVDRTTADAYVRDLGAIGARVVIESADAETSGQYRAGRSTSDPIPHTTLRAAGAVRPTTPPAGIPSRPTPTSIQPPTQAPSRPTPTSIQPPTRPTPNPVTGPIPLASRVATPPSGLSAAGDVAPARPSNPTGLAAAGDAALGGRSGSSSPQNEPRAPSTTNAPFASGLSAAFTGEIPLDLGALGQDHEFALSSVDGEESSPPAASFGPPDTSFETSFDTSSSAEPGLPASFGPAVQIATPPPKPAVLDRFAPPESSHEVPLDFAIDDDAHRSRAASTPPTTAGTTGTIARTSSPSIRDSSPSIGAKSQPLAQVRQSQPMIQPTGGVAAAPAEMPRGRFLAGVILALVIGFVPAHFIGGMQESTAYAAIDREVITYQKDPTVSDGEVESYRAGRLDAKKSKRTKIALTSMLVWAFASGVFAFVWFRKSRAGRAG